MSAVRKLELDPAAVDQICEIINKVTGIQLGTKQRSMVESRLLRYLMEKGYNEFDSYWSFFKRNKDSEVNELVSLLTTHHTYFFREFNQFEFVNDKLLSNLVEKAKKRIDKKIKIWAAACSQGHEVYSLAMFFSYHLKNYPGVTFEILGTDIDAQSVKIASNGVYRYSDIKEVPMQYIEQHWSRGTGDIKDFVRAKDSLKSKVKFSTSNLMQMDGVHKSQIFDLIFCRNVFIYFKPSDIRSITANLMDHLDEGGHLFIGISENLNDLKLPLDNIGMSIYRKKGAQPQFGLAQQPKPEAQKIEQTQSPLRVICVDDSPSVLSILKRILSDDGFQVVATASNGLEAAEIIKKTPCDVVTLDIHMPEMNGLDYLKKYFNPSHPPVVIVSSVSRDDVQNAHTGLKSGAADFIEKPTLANLKEVSQELKSKLKAAAKNKEKTKEITQADKDFSRTVKIENPGLCKRIIYVSKDGILAKDIFQSWPDQNVSTTFLFENPADVDKYPLTEFSKSLTTKFDYTSGLIEVAMSLSKETTTSLVALGTLDSDKLVQLQKLKPGQFIVEENLTNLKLLPTGLDIVPRTSINYNSTEFLSRVKK